MTRITSAIALSLCAATSLTTPLQAQSETLPAARPAPSLPADAENPALLRTVTGALAQAPAGTRFGLLVETLQGQPVVSIAPDQRFIPASNTKIFTTITAYAMMPRLQAAARGDGVQLLKRSHGAADVVLTGFGDARLSSAPDCTVDCLATLADAIAAHTHKVHDVIGDDTWFPDQRWSPGMSWNNIPWTYGTGISALTLDDNQTSLTITPGQDGAVASVASPGYYTIDNAVRTVPGVQDRIGAMRMPGSRTVRLTGTIGASHGPVTLKLGIDDPARYAAWRLRAMLEARGVKVTGTLGVRHRPLTALDDPATRDGAAPARPVAPAMFSQLPALPLSEDVKITNKVSQNLHAELFLRQVSRLDGSGSIADGEAVRAKVMAQAGVPEGSWTLADGSGMSSYNRVTPRAVVTLLRWAQQQPWGAAWRATLPVGGVDGTLKRRFRATPLTGRIDAKTGSLNASRALSGYFVTASGRTLVFSALANDIPPKGAGAATAAIDKAIEAVAAAN